MRVIKFRVWDCELKEMIYDAQDESGYESDGFTDFLHQESRYKVMQFTGLLDKSGKEIWEGDVIALTANAYHDLDLTMKLAAKGHRAEVIYSEGCFIWYVGNFMYSLNQLIPKTVDQEVKYMFLDALNCDHKGLTCEVLGNIYENGDLLK